MSEETFLSSGKDLGCTSNILMCILLTSIYVGSLYIWSNNSGRDHPSTIKKRFFSVFLVSIVSAIIVYFYLNESYLKYNLTYWSVLGVRKAGFLTALILPLILTMVLFLGPLCIHFYEGVYNNLFDLKHWQICVTNIMWLRNHVVAPLFEEFGFRACMLPILVPCFGTKASIILCPVLFGIAHLHRLTEKLSSGVELKVAVLQSLFQFFYTTIFGAYSTFLFLRTGHLVAPCIVHAFCNHMGFPDFGQLLTIEQPKQSLIVVCFIIGLIAWIILLDPLTDPILYSNSAYWPL